MKTRTPIHIPRALIALVVVAGVLIAALPAAATPKDEISARRIQAEAARAKIAALGAQLEPAIERYNKAIVEMKRVQEQIAYNQKMIGVTKANLVTTQDALSTKLVQSYRVGEPDLLSSVFGQESLTNVLAVSDLFARSQTQAADLITGLQKDKRALKHQQDQLKSDRKRVLALRAQRAAEKAAIDHGISQQKSYANGLEAEIAQLVAEDKARQEKLRQQAAAALDAQAAATAAAATESDIAIGGSVAGSDGGSSSSGGGGNDTSVSVPATDGSIGARAVSIAMQYLGTPYVWGGSSPGGFDCSGLTMYAYGQLGISLSHYTGSQWNEGVHIPSSQLLPGDLVFFHSDLHHMGMYIGNGQMIHAPQTGDVVKISPLMSDYAGAVRPY